MRSGYCAQVVLAVIRRGTFIESHDDIRPQVFLDCNGFLGGQAMRRTVDVALKGYPFLIYLAHLGQGENLEASRIGQDWPLPVHKIVQSAQLSHQVIPRAQV